MVRRVYVVECTVAFEDRTMHEIMGVFTSEVDAQTYCEVMMPKIEGKLSDVAPVYQIKTTWIFDEDCY